MIKKIALLLWIILFLGMSAGNLYAASKYDTTYDQGQRDALCKKIEASSITVIESSLDESGLIPKAVLDSVYQSTYQISNTVSRIMALGQALTCHAVYTSKNEISIMNYKLAEYPDISVWLCGAVIYFMGFMMTLSITFYLVDIGFKLGFSIIALPVAIACWPFAWTKDKLPAVLSMMLHSAAIFAFLSLTTTYVFQLVNQALEGTDDIFADIQAGKVEAIADKFTLTATTFLLCIFALVYGMKLIGATVADFADKFFPDKVAGSASPMHGSLTQMMDFAKKEIATPVASYAKDVAKNAGGHVLKGSGKLITGQYNNQIRKAAHYVANPNELADKAIQKGGQAAAWVTQKGGKAVSGALTGTVGRAFLGKEASQDLQESINQKLNSGAEAIKTGAQAVGAAANEAIQNSAIGRGAEKAREAVHTAAGAVQAARETYNEGLDLAKQKFAETKVGKAAQKVGRAIQTVENFCDGGIQAINDAKKGLDQFGEAVEDVAVGGIDNFKQKALKPANYLHKKINNLFTVKNTDSTFTKGLKKGLTVIGIKRTLNVAASVVTLDPLIRTASGAAKWTVMGTRAGVHTVLCTPMDVIGKGACYALKAPIIVPRTIIKIIKPKNVVNAVGGALENVGDQMTHNKKSAAEIKYEKARRQAEWDEEDRRKRLKEEQDNN